MYDLGQNTSSASRPVQLSMLPVASLAVGRPLLVLEKKKSLLRSSVTSGFEIGGH